MTVDAIRDICRALPGVTEDVKWGNDLCFCVGEKMFAAMDLNPPYAMAFKCTPEDFGDLIERPGVRPAPYLARAMWVQEEALGEALDRAELERLLKRAYELVLAKLPKSRRAGVTVAGRARAQRGRKEDIDRIGPFAQPAVNRRGMTKPSRMRSLKVSEGFRSFVLDQIQALGDVTARSMFGGVGLYCDGLFFGIIAGDVLYLKADEANRPDYERAGALPFRPYADRAGKMRYYAVPVGILESEPDLLEWARKAVAAAGPARSATPARSQRGRGRRPPRRRAKS